jgi:tetratricopeptide (TPR) repeat protein
MRQITFLFFALTICSVGTSHAQQTSNQALGNSTSATSNQPAMTPRQIAEMRADVMMARKEYELAIASYQDILKSEPKNAVVLNKVGISYQQIGDQVQAEHYYRKSMAADKHFPTPINNLGTLEYGRQHYSKSIKLYLKAASLKMNVAPIYSNLAYAYEANKEYTKAMDAVAKALAADPGVFDHRSDGAGSVVQQRTSPDPGVLFFLMAKSYAKLGDAEHTAHYLKLARDGGYKEYKSAEKDPVFAPVIKDPRVQEVLKITPSYMAQPDKPVSE